MNDIRDSIQAGIRDIEVITHDHSAHNKAQAYSKRFLGKKNSRLGRA